MFGASCSCAFVQGCSQVATNSGIILMR